MWFILLVGFVAMVMLGVAVFRASASGEGLNLVDFSKAAVDQKDRENVGQPESLDEEVILLREIQLIAFHQIEYLDPSPKKKPGTRSG